MNISAFSTKAITNDGTKYNNRTSEDIDSAIYYVMNGNQTERPFYSSSIGFTENDPEKISDEIKELQHLYRKETGIRIRGEVVEISKDELSKGKEKEQIENVADSYSAHFLYKGFQTAYGVFDNGDNYRIFYAINPVSYGDGSKYRHNNTEILDEQLECLRAVMSKVINPKEMINNFEEYEYY